MGVAVSGGADSVCLLYLLRALASRWDLRLTVLHLDHRLRGEASRQDAQFVRELAASLGLEAHLGEIDVATLRAETGDNLEQAARRARREFLLGFIRSGRLDRVATGHTRDDQAETVLFRFLRGSGTAGLAAIRPVTAEGLVRPLIEIGREQARTYLAERGLAWHEDATNLNSDFARNRIRHRLLPQLIREWNPSLVDTLAHTACWADEDERYWAAETGRLAATEIRYSPPCALLRADRLAALPPAAARRLVRRAIETVKGDLRGISFAHVDRVLESAARQDGHDRTQVPGLDIVRSFDWIRFAPANFRRTEEYRLGLPVPGAITCPGTSTTLRLELIESASPADCVYNGRVSRLEWRNLPEPLELRNWRPGDQYQPAGRSARERIKVLFHEARIPVWERAGWPVISAGGEIAWSSHFGPAARLAATPVSRPVLVVEETLAEAVGGRE